MCPSVSFPHSRANLLTLLTRDPARTAVAYAVYLRARHESARVRGVGAALVRGVSFSQKMTTRRALPFFGSRAGGKKPLSTRGALFAFGGGCDCADCGSLGLDRQFVALELLNSLGEQPVLRLKVVVVEDGVPGIGERRDDSARHLGDRVQKVANKPLRCSERAEAAEI